MAFAAGIGIAAALLLYAAKTDGMNVMTGRKRSPIPPLSGPGLARRIFRNLHPRQRCHG
jgi:hypothetical protein